MSRLFEALQRSEPESVGVNFAQPEALVNELLKTAELEVPETATEPGARGVRTVPLFAYFVAAGQPLGVSGIRRRAWERKRSAFSQFV